MDVRLIMAVAGSAGALLCLVLFLRAIRGRYQRQIWKRMALGTRSPSGEQSPSSIHTASSDTSTSCLAKLLPTGDADLQLYRERLVRAGLKSPNALSLFFTARLIGFILPAVVALAAVWTESLALKQGLFGGAAASGLGYMSPSVWLDRRIVKRSNLLRRGIPDFLDLMIVCLRSGLSLSGTLQRVGEEIRITQPLLAEELAVMQREITLGTPIERAFRNFADRTGIDVLRTLSTFIHEAQRFGSEIVDAFRSQADMMRYQREQHAEEQAQRASVKILFPMLILILPAVFVVLAGPAAIQIQQAFSR